jgi:heme-degrading monooxygenase HmoA
MHARVSTYQFDANRIDEAVTQFRDAMGELEGTQEAVLLVDRSTGKGVTITYWESAEAAAESRDTANRLRTEASERAGGSVTSVEEFEVALKETPVAARR